MLKLKQNIDDINDNEMPECAKMIKLQDAANLTKEYKNLLDNRLITV